MKYVVNTCTEPQWNMAHDEFLLEELTETVFCLWQNRPSVIVGLNQNPYAEVDVKYLEANNITLARRVTGGGGQSELQHSRGYRGNGGKSFPHGPYAAALRRSRHAVRTQ